jgi:hypothetical protein
MAKHARSRSINAKLSKVHKSLVRMQATAGNLVKQAEHNWCQAKKITAAKKCTAAFIKEVKKAAKLQGNTLSSAAVKKFL